MIDLCTATNSKYLKNALLLADSYVSNGYTGKIYLYYFNILDSDIKNIKLQYPHIEFILVPKVCEHAYEPNVFFYKTYAIKHCLQYSDCFLYSDATNLFQQSINIVDYFLNESLFLPYTNPILINKYWTTQKCFYKMNAEQSKTAPQYWAGLQGYKNIEQNHHFINLMYEYMLDPEIACPGTLTDRPDGENADCIQHRADQSVFSVLIDKLNRHQPYNEERYRLFGDKQTQQLFDRDYRYSEKDCCISSRHTKFLRI